LIKGKMTTTCKGQEGVTRLREALAKYPNAYVTIGVHEGAGVYPPDADGNPGPLVAEVALWMEWGTRTIYPRPFMSQAIDEKTELINQWREQSMKKIASGEWDVPKALESMGFRLMTLVQRKIKSNMPPQNFPDTVKQKRKDGVPARTLVWSGLLLRSITYQVHLG
jgi:hypothetical protein